jgi:hypothetical protein
MGLTNLESLVKSIFGLFTKKAYNGSCTTGADFVPLSNVDTPAQTVWISAITGAAYLSVKTGNTEFYIPDGAIVPINHVNNLQDIFIKVDDGSSQTITYRYEC